MGNRIRDNTFEAIDLEDLQTYLNSGTLGEIVSITYTLSLIPCFWLGMVFLQPSLVPLKLAWT